jgi:hypothetical protein
MHALRDHAKDHGPRVERRLLRAGCESELGAGKDCRSSSNSKVSDTTSDPFASLRMR